jgi:hypothetical protein
VNFFQRIKSRHVVTAHPTREELIKSYLTMSADELAVNLRACATALRVNSDKEGKKFHTYYRNVLLVLEGKQAAPGTPLPPESPEVSYARAYHESVYGLRRPFTPPAARPANYADAPKAKPSFFKRLFGKS